MKTLAICIPCADGKVVSGLLEWFALEQLQLMLLGWSVIPIIQNFNSILPDARNRLAHEFLKTNADKMVFIDSDIVPENGALAKLIQFNVDIVAATYLVKFKEEETYPVVYLDKDELWANADNLIEVEAVPTGFMVISRNTLDAMVSTFTDRDYVTHDTNEAIIELFAFIRQNRQLHGEDFWFCQQARTLGLKVFLAPEVTITHGGRKGCLGTWLRQQMEKTNGTGRDPEKDLSSVEVPRD